MHHLVKGKQQYDKKVAIVGGGPAGLTAEDELSKAGMESIVLEKDQMVDGISRTVKYNDYYFDIGGHRFFTKVKAVNDMWHEVLNGDFLRCSRLSLIYYKKILPLSSSPLQCSVRIGALEESFDPCQLRSFPNTSFKTRRNLRTMGLQPFWETSI